MSFDDILGHTTPITWLRHALQANRLAHAYLFLGDQAIGKRMTAVQFILAMNCETSTSTPDACQTCRSCEQIMHNIHPDVLVIEPEEGQGHHPQIKIERIREIEHHVIYRPLMSQRKICLIDQADRLTVGAANALLKTLEEPPEHCLFILITSKPLALLPTMKSRCLQVRFSPLSQEHVIRHLVTTQQYSEEDARFISFLTQGRLGEALTLDLNEAKTKQQEHLSLVFRETASEISTSFEAAESLAKSGNIPEALQWLWSGLRDLLLVATQSPVELVGNQQYVPILEQFAERIPVVRIVELLEELTRLEQGLQRNLNMQLGFEQFFIHLRDALTHAPS